MLHSPSIVTRSTDRLGGTGEAYSTQAWCWGHTLSDHNLLHDLEARVWTHHGTTWVSLSGHLTDQVATSLVRLLLNDRPSLDVVLNIDELSQGSSTDERLLVLCADLSVGGRAVCVVGPNSS